MKVKPNTRQPRLLVVDDDPDAIRIEREILSDGGFDVVTATSGEEALALIDELFFDLLVLDQKMGDISGSDIFAASRERHPDIVALFLTGYHDEAAAVKALNLGASKYLYKPVSAEQLVAVVQGLLDESQIARENRFYRSVTGKQDTFAEIVGSSQPLMQAMQFAKEAMETDVPILLLGESGTGKELFARAIHNGSRRRAGPFRAINATAIPRDLMESTLFGHKKGAFTGAASDRQGVFQAAEGGTLLLDEIGDMPKQLQPKLLRVLQEKVVQRVGEDVDRPVNVRVIAATNHNLRAEANVGRFRQDLYYRLAVVQITLPALRERREDIPSLVLRLLERGGREIGKRITRINPDAMEKLKAYSWPGNVRELENVIKLAIIRARGDTVEVDNLYIPEEVEQVKQPASIPADSRSDDVIGEDEKSSLTFREALAEFERMYFSELLSRSGGNIAKAAKLAGLNRTSMYSHMSNAGLHQKLSTKK